MKVVHLLRKPCSEPTVATNVLKHGTAGLNIEASRVSAGGDPEAIRLAGILHCDRDTAEIASRVAQQGRWPANLILQHLDGCVQDSTETIAAWTCAPGCPVAALDQQSGAASRFFHQSHTPPYDYFRKLISPDHLPGAVYLHVTEPDAFGWSEHGASSLHGMLVKAQSVEGQAAWLPEAFRALRPGGHLLLAAPDDEPIGDTGACAAEVVGFEVRDCILHASGADAALHYAAKASRAEREAGAGGAGVSGVGGRANTHPTVKPIGVMRRLLADVPRTRGPVVDPFAGSGTTLLACVDTGHDAIGIEREDEYVRIAQARLDHRRAAGPKGRAAGLKSRG